MITNSRIGMTQQLGVQLTVIANLMCIADNNNQVLVFWDELRKYRQGYQFEDVFDINSIKYIKRSAILEKILCIYRKLYNESGSWKKYNRFSIHRFIRIINRYISNFLYILVKSKYRDFVEDNDGLQAGIMIDKRLFELSKDKNYDISGGFGTYKSYKQIENKIKESFVFKKEIIEAGDKKIESIRSITNKQIVSVHFRRTDYLIFYSLNLGADYYSKAINKFDKDKYFFVIFSDDIEGCKDYVKENNLFIDCDYTFSDKNSFGLDMYLMSRCDHNIIANSSFSFWSALLNKNDHKIVVCPHDFVSEGTATKNVGKDSLYLNGNYYPDEWIAI